MVWMTMTIFTAFLRAMDASIGVQGRNILLSVDSWATHLQDMWCMRKNQGCALSTRLHRHVTPSWCGHKRIFKTVVHEAPSTERLCLMECGKGSQVWKSLFCKNMFHSSGLVTSHSQRMSVVYIIMAVGINLWQKPTQDCIIADEDETFHENWISLSTKMHVYGSSCVSVDAEVVTCSASSSGELCDDCEWLRIAAVKQKAREMITTWFIAELTEVLTAYNTYIFCLYR